MNLFNKLFNRISAVWRLSGISGGTSSIHNTGAAYPTLNFSISDSNLVTAFWLAADIHSSLNSVPKDSVSQKRLTCSTSCKLMSASAMTWWIRAILDLSLLSTAPCRVHPNRVLEAVGSSSLPNLDSIAVIRTAWSNPINTSTRPPQVRRGGRSARWLHRPRIFSHSITATGLVIDGIVDPWIDTISSEEVFSRSSRYSEVKCFDDSSPTPLTTKVCRCPASRSRRARPSRMSVESLPSSISTLTGTVSPLASRASTRITLNANCRRPPLSVCDLAVFSAGAFSLCRSR